ncbi:MAG: 50S ribosomal protein L13 [Candidatus Dormibacteria bacterium]
MTQKTWTPTEKDLVSQWYLVDAEGQTLGRLASNVAKLLRGKHKPTFTPHINSGDHVIVVNASKVHWTGRKGELKTYGRYSGYPGGLSVRTLDEMAKRQPTEPIMHAVGGMLQHNTLGRDMLKRLRVYAGPTHRHESQQPVTVRFDAKGEVQVNG